MIDPNQEPINANAFSSFPVEEKIKQLHSIIASSVKKVKNEKNIDCDTVIKNLMSLKTIGTCCFISKIIMVTFPIFAARWISLELQMKR